MAKKSRRERRVARPPAAPRVMPSQPGSAPAASISPAGVQRNPAVSATRTATPVSRTIVDFREEYRYVVQDLRRIAVLAGVIFTSLIVLSFVLR